MNKSLIFKSVNMLLYILFILGGIFLFTFEIVMDMKFEMTFEYIIYRTLFSVLGVLVLFITLQLIRIFRTIKKDTPFIHENVISLKNIAVTGVVMGLIFLIAYITDKSYLKVIAGMCFICAGLCAYVFSQLFKSAVHIKEENDYTI